MSSLHSRNKDVMNPRASYCANLRPEFNMNEFSYCHGLRSWGSPTQTLGPNPNIPCSCSDLLAHRLRWKTSGSLHLKYDDTIANIVQNISLPQMKNDITWLTGENEDSKILSRHSFSKGARIAASWISDRMEDTGAQCELRPFLTGFAPNIIW